MMEEKLMQIFNELGLYIESTEYDEDLDMDSMTFITLVARVEDDFEIKIPDEKFSYEELSSFRKVMNAICEIS